MGNLSDVIEDRNVAPLESDFSPIPPGWYEAEITEQEVKQTKSGGLMFKVTWEIKGDEYTNRKIWGQFNIVNASEKAQQIGRGQLSALCQACGLSGIPEDGTEILNVRHKIKVGIEESPGYEPRNAVKAYKSLQVEAPRKIGNIQPTAIEDDKLPDTTLPF